MRPRRRIEQRRNGFSLLELTVSLVAGGMAVAGAAALLFGLGSRADAIRAVSLASDRAANAEHTIRLLVANLDAGADTIALRGDGESVQFPTWCETRFAWSERCQVRLAFRHGGGSRALILERLNDASASTGGRAQEREIVLFHDIESAHFLYLLDAADGGRWARSWSLLTVPAALGIVTGGDTLILPVW